MFTSGSDPVEVGLVTSLSRPGGNVTGVSWFASELGPKRLGLLNELVPNITLAALIVNPRNPEFVGQVDDAKHAAQALGWQVHVITASNLDEVEAAFSDAKRQRVHALVMGADPFFRSHRAQIVAQAAHLAIPTIHVERDFVVAGGLISYGNSVWDAYRRAGLHIGRLLRGVKPSDLPVDRSTKFELVINLKTAKALGITVSPALLARADEVIE